MCLVGGSWDGGGVWSSILCGRMDDGILQGHYTDLNDSEDLCIEREIMQTLEHGFLTPKL